MLKAGGKQELQDAVASSRCIKVAARGGLMMYFFPRLTYSKDNLLKQALSGAANKHSGGIGDLAVENFGHSWDPEKIIPDELVGKVPGMDNGGSMAIGPSLSSPKRLQSNEGDLGLPPSHSVCVCACVCSLPLFLWWWLGSCTLKIKCPTQVGGKNLLGKLMVCEKSLLCKLMVCEV